MRFLRLDCNEFEVPSSEEEITFHQSHMRYFSDISAFIAETDKDLGGVAEDLLKFLNLVICQRHPRQVS